MLPRVYALHGFGGPGKFCREQVSPDKNWQTNSLRCVPQCLLQAAVPWITLRHGIGRFLRTLVWTEESPSRSALRALAHAALVHLGKGTHLLRFTELPAVAFPCRLPHGRFADVGSADCSLGHYWQRDCRPAL